MNIPTKSGSEAGIRFLLADDDLINQRIFEELIVAMGNSVDVVPNGQAAVEHYLLNSYSVILLDISMPVMNGLDCSREIRRIERIDEMDTQVTIIGCTMNNSPEFYVVCRDAGMDGVMIKPPTVAKLETVVKAAIRRRRIRADAHV